MVMISSVNLIRHSDLGSITSDQHHAQAHQATHASGGNDVITKMSRIHTAEYTGNGATSQGITGVGFSPKFVLINAKKTSADGTPEDYSLVYSTDIVVDDVSGGAAWSTQQNNSVPDWALIGSQIISIDSDGFTVDDAGTDTHPNKNSQVYNYLAIG